MVDEVASAVVVEVGADDVARGRVVAGAPVVEDAEALLGEVDELVVGRVVVVVALETSVVAVGVVVVAPAVFLLAGCSSETRADEPLSVPVPANEAV